ncbi:MAG TPA: hypothetical protein VIJ23_16335 [Mycobacterium sp.]
MRNRSGVACGRRVGGDEEFAGQREGPRWVGVPVYRWPVGLDQIWVWPGPRVLDQVL